MYGKSDTWCIIKGEVGFNNLVKGVSTPYGKEKTIQIVHPQASNMHGKNIEKMNGYFNQKFDKEKQSIYLKYKSKLDPTYLNKKTGKILGFNGDIIEPGQEIWVSVIEYKSKYGLSYIIGDLAAPKKLQFKKPQEENIFSRL